MDKVDRSLTFPPDSELECRQENILAITGVSGGALTILIVHIQGDNAELIPDHLLRADFLESVLSF